MSLDMRKALRDWLVKNDPTYKPTLNIAFTKKAKQTQKKRFKKDETFTAKQSKENL